MVRSLAAANGQNWSNQEFVLCQRSVPYAMAALAWWSGQA